MGDDTFLHFKIRHCGEGGRPGLNMLLTLIISTHEGCVETRDLCAAPLVLGIALVLAFLAVVGIVVVGGKRSELTVGAIGKQRTRRVKEGGKRDVCGSEPPNATA